MRSKALSAYCTFPNEAIAEQICERLVAENLIACANIYGPVKSIYRWAGTLNKEQEYVAIFKTTEAKRGALKERIRGVHPYSNPCLVFWRIEDGLPDFLNWISTETL